MKTQYTPGPWEYKEGRILTKKKIIAELDQCLMSNKEHYSNASLISAAPELLDALTLLLQGVEQGELISIEDGMDKAKIAIAKAEGK